MVIIRCLSYFTKWANYFSKLDLHVKSYFRGEKKVFKATDADYMMAHFKDSVPSLGIKNGSEHNTVLRSGSNHKRILTRGAELASEIVLNIWQILLGYVKSFIRNLIDVLR